MQLQNLQAEIAEALINDSNESLKGICPYHHINIYRNNITSNFLNILRETYPLINKLLGSDYFDVIARDYIKHYPSCSSNLNDYGEYFGSFLSQQESLQKLPYLNEVALFEWACHKIFFAADANQFNSERLKNISPEQYAELRFILHPASELIKFNFPILKIIDLCHGNIDEITELNESGVNLLIIRRELDITLLALSPSDFGFLNALQNNSTLEEALNIALSIDSHFNLEEKLPRWIKDKTIVDCA